MVIIVSWLHNHDRVSALRMDYIYEPPDDDENMHIINDVDAYPEHTRTIMPG